MRSTILSQITRLNDCDRDASMMLAAKRCIPGNPIGTPEDNQSLDHAGMATESRDVPFHRSMDALDFYFQRIIHSCPETRPISPPRRAAFGEKTESELAEQSPNGSKRVISAWVIGYRHASI